MREALGYNGGFLAFFVLYATAVLLSICLLPNVDKLQGMNASMENSAAASKEPKSRSAPSGKSIA